MEWAYLVSVSLSALIVSLMLLNQLDLYPEGSLKTTQLLFVDFGQKEEIHLLPLIAKVRKAGIRTELYPESTKNEKANGICGR